MQECCIIFLSFSLSFSGVLTNRLLLLIIQAEIKLEVLAQLVIHAKSK